MGYTSVASPSEGLLTQWCDYSQSVFWVLLPLCGPFAYSLYSFLFLFLFPWTRKRKEGFSPLSVTSLALPIMNLGYLPNKDWTGLWWFLELFSHTSRGRQRLCADVSCEAIISCLPLSTSEQFWEVLTLVGGCHPAHTRKSRVGPPGLCSNVSFTLSSWWHLQGWQHQDCFLLAATKIYRELSLPHPYPTSPTRHACQHLLLPWVTYLLIQGQDLILNSSGTSRWHWSNKAMSGLLSCAPH